MRVRNVLRLVAAAVAAILPAPLKRAAYRHVFGYRIAPDVRIGLSIFIRVGQCTIGEGTRIGHFNIFTDLDHLSIGEGTRIGTANVIRGGRAFIGSYCTLIRGNVLNSIPHAECTNVAIPEIHVGDGCTITNQHWLDYTDRIAIGHNSIIGGRGSSFWTHNRQRSRPVSVGHHCYFGSDVRVAPGASVPSLSVIGLGAIVTGPAEEAGLIAGNPARRVRALRPDERGLVARRTRPDVPDSVAYRDLDDGMIDAANAVEQAIARVQAGTD